jgi:hypothetical protein
MSSCARSARLGLLYEARCLDDLHTMPKAYGDWIEVGSADEQRDAKLGMVEAWGRLLTTRSADGYGLKKSLRGRFGMYIPPLMERLRLAEVEHKPRGNRMRAI